MTPTANLQKIAKVLKSNGTDGELLISFFAMDPEDLEISEPVFILFDGLPVPFFVQSLRRRGQNKALVHLNGIFDLKDCEEVCGKDIYLPADAEAAYGEGDFSFLVGWELRDAGKSLGRIADFVDIPGNPCLELEDGRLVPLHEDFITAVDEDSAVVEMELPSGLLD
ncbi:MAG: hypothetical protein SOV31_04035 [Candidatus Cryptobacteroides sp.]|nr:hypothetical protein [Bacteroidales bacterium]MDY2706886.1 hypothetical protein [Candidatus Cryptobacteroides sp.]